MRILCISGGSGGHLFPLIAVWRAVQTLQPDTDALFVCSDKPEDGEILKGEGIIFRTLPAIRRSWTMPLQLRRNAQESKLILDDFRPDVVFTKGGAVSIPLCVLAARRGIPFVLHESDAVWGRANRLLMKRATKICLGFPSPDSSSSSVLTGNPVRPEIMTGNREEGLRITGLSGKKPVLLVIGGSQGATAINEAVVALLDPLLKLADIVHITGKGKKGAEKRDGYVSMEFAGKQLPHLYAVSTVALSRAGAGTIAELAANAIPTIVVPLRGVAQDHQLQNAGVAARAGGCVLLHQEDMKHELVENVESLITDSTTLEQMRTAQRLFHKPDAAERIAGVILECAATK